MPLPKMVPEVKARWVAALRSGRYKQGTGQLRRFEYLFDAADSVEYHDCCLGVLCDVYAQDHPEWDWHKNADRGTPPVVVAEWSGLGYAENVEDVPLIEKLTDFNDQKGWSFNQIAAYVERWL